LHAVGADRVPGARAAVVTVAVGGAVARLRAADLRTVAHHFTRRTSQVKSSQNPTPAPKPDDQTSRLPTARGSRSASTAMVDEGEAAADAAPPAAAPAPDWDAADATDGPTDANLGADKTAGGDSSVDSPPIGLGAPRVEGAARAPPPVRSGRQGKADEVPEQRLVTRTAPAAALPRGCGGRPRPLAVHPRTRRANPGILKWRGRSGGLQAAVRHDTVVTRRRRSSRDGGVE